MPVELKGSAPVEEDDDRPKKRKKKKRKDRDDDEIAVRAAPDDDAPPPKKRRRRSEDGPADAEVAAPAPRPDPMPAPHPAETARLFINRGSTDGYDEPQIAQLVVDSAGGSGADEVRRIQLRKTHAFVEVTPELADAAVAGAARGIEREDKPVAIERARTR